MNAARVLVPAVTLVASVVVYLLMRHLELRRPQFEGGRVFFVSVSLTCAVGLSRSSIYQAIGRGQFPAGVKVGVRARRWRAQAIEEWLAGLRR
jgi:hypothetical protein